MADDKPVPQSQSATSGDSSQVVQVARDLIVTVASASPQKPSSIISPTNAQVVQYDPKVRFLLEEVKISLGTVKMGDAFIINHRLEDIKQPSDKQAYVIVFMLMALNFIVRFLIG